MLLELALKGLLAATLVWLALTVGQRKGARAAGLVAAAVSVPSLALLAWSHGSAFVAEAAIGSLLATPACAAFAAAYVATQTAVARRWRAAAAVVPGVVPGVLAALLACALAAAALRWPDMHSESAAAAVVPLAALVAAVSAVAAQRLTRGPGIPCITGASDSARLQALLPGVSPWLCATAGLTTALVCAAADGLGAAASGLLAGMPVVAACLAASTGAARGPRAARRAMHSYAGGLLPRAAFLLPVAAASVWLGWPVAMLAGLLAAAALGVLMNRPTLRRARPVQAWPTNA